MSSLHGKKILLGVSGGIAAYKSPDLVRRLREQGAEVRVVMTASAVRFVSPTVFQAVSRINTFFGLTVRASDGQSLLIMAEGDILAVLG